MSEGLEDQKHGKKMGEGSWKFKQGKADGVCGRDKSPRGSGVRWVA